MTSIFFRRVGEFIHRAQVSLMVLKREGGRMVAKLELEDPNVRAWADDWMGLFQRGGVGALTA